jgi:hypothetical protein
MAAKTQADQLPLAFALLLGIAYDQQIDQA